MHVSTAAASTPSCLMPTYAPQPVAFVRGEGVWLFDADGKRYLDALSGIAVNTLGHAHPALVSALCEQAGRILHHSNLFQNPLAEALARALVERSGMTNVFFCNSGLEANEAAIKIARKYGYDRGIEAPEIIVFEHAFHGRSLATLSATGNEKVQKGFAPLVPGFVRVPLNDIAALEAVAHSHPKAVAVFIEAIQGEGGIQPAQIAFLQAARRLCDAHDWLFMIDEVQCGMARTGRWFAHQWAEILPDVMPLAKGLGSGVPVGAVVAHGKAAQVFGPGNHGTTFGGNPLAMRAGLVTLETIEAENLMANALVQEQRIRAGLSSALAGVPGVLEIRGRGLMLGIVLDRPCGALVAQALEAGLVLNVTADHVVRLLPPLIFQDAHSDQLVATLAPLIRRFLT